MARPLRIDIPDGWYHVTSRGLERRAIFKERADYRHFLDLLAAIPERYGIKIHAYVLLNNHFHIVVSTPDANLSIAMQWLKTSYSMWFNRRMRRVGPLFQGRFRAELFEGRAEAWPITRYIHLNPVRTATHKLSKSERSREAAGLVQPDSKHVKNRLTTLGSYPWSSYAYYAGVRPAPAWLDVATVLANGKTDDLASQQQSYQRYTKDILGDERVKSPVIDAVGGLFCGNPEWVERMRIQIKGDPLEQAGCRRLARHPTWEEIKENVERERGLPWEKFVNLHADWARDLALYLGQRYGRLSLRDLAKTGGLNNYQAVAQALFRFKNRLKQDARLRETLGRTTECIRRYR